MNKSKAFVIEVKDYGESDKIVTFFTDARGRMSGIAKGAKKSFKRFLNKLELFTLLEVYFTNSRSSSLVMVDQAELINPFPRLRETYQLYTSAALIAELILLWTRENDPDPALFELLYWTFDKLETASNTPEAIAILFQLKLLTLSGFHPDLHGCSKCGRLSPAISPFSFIASSNGLMCSQCKKNTPDGYKSISASIATIRLLQKAQDLDISKLDRLKFSRESAQESAMILKSYASQILQRDIQGWDFIMNNKGY